VTVELALAAVASAEPAQDELVRRAAAGEARAFDELVERHHGEIVRLARAVLASHADAEDLAQESWAHAWSRLGELRDSARFLPWLRRIVVRRGVRAARRRKRESFDGEGALLRIAAPAAPAAVRIEVETALRALTPRQRAVFLLTEIDGCGAAEAALRLGLAEATVRVHRLLARRRLRALFEEGRR
jgi:RNA polymerase sigma-70 factor (ECF subfamily)